MTAPHYIGENKSDMRGIKPGWYAIEDDGNLSSGPFSSREECVKRITQPTEATRRQSCIKGTERLHPPTPAWGRLQVVYLIRQTF